jgi:transcriptional regulator with XRE-family HTH domain
VSGEPIYDGEILSATRAHHMRMSLAANTRALRMERGYSQEALATACQMPRSVISRIERGQHEPRISTLLTLSDALGVTVTAFLVDLQQAQGTTHNPRFDDIAGGDLLKSEANLSLDGTSSGA